MSLKRKIARRAQATVPESSLPVNDARLYVPTKLPGMEGASGFIGQGNTPREARFIGTFPGGDLIVLATTLVALEAHGTPVKVRNTDAYLDSANGRLSVTWKRGEVVLRASVSGEAADLDRYLDSTGQDVDDGVEGLLQTATALDIRADEVIAMTDEGRAAALAKGDW